MLRFKLFAVTLGGALALGVSCRPNPGRFPWGDAPRARSTERADVHSMTPSYQRTRAQVWVREVTRPTRAALDYAAYHANFMIADPEPETPFTSTAPPDTSRPFAGAIERNTLTSDFGKLPLSEHERQQPLAFAPLSEYVQAHHVAGAIELAEVGARVHDEKWGLPLPPGSSGQTLSELYLHTPASGSPELWAKVEFQPWFKPFSGSPDQDGDGFPELYGRLPLARATPALLRAIEEDYQGVLLSPSEIKAWANQLSSYWYPSFNTDLVPAGSSFPDRTTEPEITRELGKARFSEPSIVLRGKPQGKPTYNVFLVKSGAQAAPETAAARGPILKLAKTTPSPQPALTLRAIDLELAQRGEGSWSRWAQQVAPVRQVVQRRLKAMPRTVKAVAGKDGFLFFRNSLEYVVGGDIEAQRKGKNPLPVIVEFKQELDRQGVDFLFVPVPTKIEVYPERFSSELEPWSGRVVNPYFRKFVRSLAAAGVEVVDLLPAFLAAKAETSGGEALFQHQDTHWTDRGLRVAAELLSTRVKKYPWYAELSKHRQLFQVREASFTRFGDLHSRLPAGEQKTYLPEALTGRQVLRADGQPYEDDPDSPLVLLGDSFTSVYELTDIEHAGVSAHLARGISYPLDLVMSYGGGPNVRQKLLRRGEAALGSKKLVIWLMTARDLYNYWEEWEPLHKP